MALLNFRLGYWSNNPNPLRTGNSTRKASWYRLMLREMLGRGLSETCPQIHLSDGGHFENLGIYELLRRRCRYIIASDAGADPKNTMSDLGKLIQRARADFSVDIEIDITTLGTTNDSGKNRPWRLGLPGFVHGPARGYPAGAVSPGVRRTERSPPCRPWTRRR